MEKNLTVHPLNVYLIFSSLKKNMTSLSHWEIEGYLTDFQCNNKERLASKDVKAIMSFCVGLSASVGSGIPNIAIRGQGWRLTPRTEDIIAK